MVKNAQTDSACAVKSKKDNWAPLETHLENWYVLFFSIPLTAGTAAKDMWVLAG